MFLKEATYAHQGCVYLQPIVTNNYKQLIIYVNIFMWSSFPYYSTYP